MNDIEDANDDCEENQMMVEPMNKEKQMRPTELLESVSRGANKTLSGKEKNRVGFCPFCGKPLAHQKATLYDARHLRIAECKIAWCCRQEPLVVIE